MTTKKPKIGWIGAGRMGFEMALRLAKGGCDITVWNRTRAKAEPLAQYGAKIAQRVSELAGCDVVFCMVSTYADVKEVVAGKDGLMSQAKKTAKGKHAAPRILVECSSISLEGSAELRGILAQHGSKMLAAPVSGNAKVIKAGKLSFVCSGPRAVFDEVSPLLKLIAPAASYVGEGELARIVKICHNVFLGVVIQSLCEITVLAQKAGVPRHAFLEFINQSVMGSVFSRYKTPALVNLDFKVTFTPTLLRKDLDLGLDAGRKFEVPLPLASVTRDLIQSMMGSGLSEQDFATLLLQQARASGIELQPEKVAVGDGLA
ncbi:MAG: NAD(P)-dependent oxidoreductase [Burkholderiales bacterium]|jgi:3-hydroxyisobutyrate dehydrogenase-like beta-hydroxyacid dehydrogenase